MSARQPLPLPAALASVAFLPPASQAEVIEPPDAGPPVGGRAVRHHTHEARVLQHVLATDFRQAVIHANGEAGTAPDSLSPVIVEAGRSPELPPHGRALRLEEAKHLLRASDKTLSVPHFDGNRVVFANAEIPAAPPSRSGFDT